MTKIVKVKWSDAQRIETSLWDEEEIKEIEPIECEIVGFLICEDKKKITIAQERWNFSKQVKYSTIIPKCSIIKISELKEIKK